MRNKTIKVESLARVEGEGAFTVEIKNGRVADVQLRIYEPPRFFEGLLRGRAYTEAPDLTARICGICPVAYQMTAVQAIEAACGISVTEPMRMWRRLLVCGEWIESHALHVHLLHAPDFLGYPDGLRMAKDHPEAVQRGLGIKRVGNDLLALLGGREIHPINVRVGGCYRAPGKKELETLRERLQWAVEASLETVRWVAGLPFPSFERDYTFVSLRHASEYPMNEGRIVSSGGWDLPVEAYENHCFEEQVAHSHALHSKDSAGGTYLVGPLARYSLNFDRLSPLARETARSAGLAPVCRNPFQSIIIRSIEILYACEEALRLLDRYEPPEQPAVDVQPRAAIGMSCTEAPRGLLYHRYRLDEKGLILEAKIVPPTSQNQKMMEDDLREIVSRYLHLPQKELTWRCEQAIRNHDPCISCATHLVRMGAN
jgi:coenzyme F420-reducing hydrogenase alpha subunit